MKKLVKAITGGSAPKFKAPVSPAAKPATPMPDQEALERSAMQEELRRKKTGRSSTNLVNEDEDNL
jgi:hypothetical protein